MKKSKFNEEHSAAFPLNTVRPGDQARSFLIAFRDARGRVKHCSSVAAWENLRSQAGVAIAAPLTPVVLAVPMPGMSVPLS